MDKKRKDSLKVLKIKLSEIIGDQEIYASARLQKLYDEKEISEFLESLLKWGSYPNNYFSTIRLKEFENSNLLKRFHYPIMEVIVKKI